MDCGVRYLGFPLRLPVHREDLGEAEAAEIIRSLPPTCQGVAITYQQDAGDIAAFMEYLGAGMVQLHGDVPAGQLARLKELRPDLQVIKSLVVGKHEPAVLAGLVHELGPLVDAFITDTYDPATGASGATGRTHDWRVSRALVALSPRPVILAGGLTADNVREAILAVGPAGVDTHTGVEDASGRKDRDKVMRFIAAAREAFAIPGHRQH
jgi:phosphoribosylanthranilate isomerase